MELLGNIAVAGVNIFICLGWPMSTWMCDSTAGAVMMVVVSLCMSTGVSNT